MDYVKASRLVSGNPNVRAPIQVRELGVLLGILADVVESTRRVLPFERLAFVDSCPHVVADVLPSVDGTHVLRIEANHLTSPFFLDTYCRGTDR